MYKNVPDNEVETIANNMHLLSMVTSESLSALTNSITASLITEWWLPRTSLESNGPSSSFHKIFNKIISSSSSEDVRKLGRRDMKSVLAANAIKLSGLINRRLTQDSSSATENLQFCMDADRLKNEKLYPTT